MASKDISKHIIQYLIEEKNYSRLELSKLMDISLTDLNKIENRTFSLTPEQLKNIVEKTKIPKWQIIHEAIPSRFLSTSMKEKLSLCKKLDDLIKKRTKK